MSLHWFRHDNAYKFDISGRHRSASEACVGIGQNYIYGATGSVHLGEMFYSLCGIHMKAKTLFSYVFLVLKKVLTKEKIFMIRISFCGLDI